MSPLETDENEETCCGGAWGEGCPLVGVDSGAALLEMPGSAGAVALDGPPHATSTCSLAPRESFARQGAQDVHSGFTVNG